MQLFRLETLNA